MAGIHIPITATDNNVSSKLDQVSRKIDELASKAQASNNTMIDSNSKLGASFGALASKVGASVAAIAFNDPGKLVAIASSYTFEEGEKNPPPLDQIFIRQVSEAEVKPKPRR